MSILSREWNLMIFKKITVLFKKKKMISKKKMKSFQFMKRELKNYRNFMMNTTKKWLIRRLRQSLKSMLIKALYVILKQEFQIIRVFHHLTKYSQQKEWMSCLWNNKKYANLKGSPRILESSRIIKSLQKEIASM